MAEYYKIDHHTINRYSKEIGFDDSIYKKRKLSEKEIDYIIQNYNNYSATKIAEYLNITKEAVSGVWFRNNLRGKDTRIYPLLNESYFEVIDTQDKAYFLGFIGADGCLYDSQEKHKNKQKILRISIRYEDIKILELFKKVLQTDKKIIWSKDIYVNLEISSNKIFDDIEKLGLSPRKTWKNTIANIPKKFMPALIRGYFDGDGSIGLSKNDSYSDVGIIISGYHENLKKIQDFLLEKNIFSVFTIDKRTYTKGTTGEFGNLYLSNRTSKYAFLKLIYENCEDYYMDRKYEKAMGFINYIENSNEIRDKQIKIYYDYAVHGIS